MMWVGCHTPIPSGVYIETLRESNNQTTCLGCVCVSVASNRSFDPLGCTYNSGFRGSRSTIEVDRGVEAFHAHHQDPAGLNSNTIRYIYQDSRGDLWVTTDVGPNRILSSDLGSDAPQFHKTLSNDSRATLSGVYTLQVLESSGGELYFGSMGSGLIRFNPQTDELIMINHRDGLANDTVKTPLKIRKRCYLGGDKHRTYKV